MVPQIKIAKILLKVAPIAIVIGAVYFFVIRPIDKAVTGPVEAISEAVTEAGEAVGEAVENIGEATGDVFTAISEPASFDRAPGAGGGFVEDLFGIGAAVQRATGGGLTWREAAVLKEDTFVEAASSLIYSVEQVAPRPTADPKVISNTRALNLDLSFNDQAVANRLTKTIRNTLNNNYSSPFGGYGSAVNQEVELRKAINASKAKYGEWFK